MTLLILRHFYTADIAKKVINPILASNQQFPFPVSLAAFSADIVFILQRLHNPLYSCDTANSEAQKKELFGRVRSGQVRVLIGSTQKMGAGTNVQTKLAALHHLDCPWRPSDLQQREGRIIRQSNENKEVDIYTYVISWPFIFGD